MIKQGHSVTMMGQDKKRGNSTLIFKHKQKYNHISKKKKSEQTSLYPG